MVVLNKALDHVLMVTANQNRKHRRSFPFEISEATRQNSGQWKPYSPRMTGGSAGEHHVVEDPSNWAGLD
jgi:hypothetical protein